MRRRVVVSSRIHDLLKIQHESLIRVRKTIRSFILVYIYIKYRLAYTRPPSYSSRRICVYTLYTFVEKRPEVGIDIIYIYNIIPSIRSPTRNDENRKPIFLFLLLFFCVFCCHSPAHQYFFSYPIRDRTTL